jgi:MoxR-like ATPase
VALLKMAQASALLDGRSYVVPDDVKALARPCSGTGWRVAPELELEGVTPDAALKGIIEKIDVPR